MAKIGSRILGRPRAAVQQKIEKKIIQGALTTDYMYLRVGTVLIGVNTHSVPTVDLFFRVEWTAAFPLITLCTIHCVLYTVLVHVEFRSGFPLWTQHHCVFTPNTTVQYCYMYHVQPYVHGQ